MTRTWSPRVAARDFIAVPALILWAALSGATAPYTTAPGMTYTIHGTTVPNGSGPMATAMEAQRSDWTGVVVFSDGRGRMDIVEGASRPMFEKGDYVLFDATDFIVVKPEARNFFGFHPDQAMRAIAAFGPKIAISNTKVSLDTLGAGEALDGHPTQHYRLNASYTMTMDMSALGEMPDGMAPPPMDAEMSMEYWFADIPNFPPNPFVKMASGMASGEPTVGAGFMSALTNSLSAARDGMPVSKAPLKTTASTRISAGPGMTSGTDNTVVITGVKETSVDMARLLLPDGYTETQMAGLENMPGAAPLSKDSGAKWRARPTSR